MFPIITKPTKKKNKKGWKSNIEIRHQKYMENYYCERIKMSKRFNNHIKEL